MNATTGLRIEGEFTIYRASEIAEALRGALASLPPGEALEVDIGGVTEMDCAGVQLMLASARSACAGGRALRLTGSSAAVDEVVATLHLDGRFAEWRAA